VATYDYPDEQGNLLFQIVRKEPGKNGHGKEFLIRQPDGNGGWKWTKKGVRLVLYGLPTFLKSEEPVVFVEGEKCVDVLRDLGIAATTNPFGAGKWQDEYSRLLEGRDVILWPDKDRAGVDHMEKVGRSLQKYAASITIVEPPADLGEKGDVADGVEKLGWTREDVQKVLDQAQPWEPRSEEESAAQVDCGVYRIEDGCLGYMKTIGRGDDATEIFAPLCNFVARVVEDWTLDDGVEVVRRFVIDLKLSGGRHLPSIQVSAAQFPSLSWVVREVGVKARISAGHGAQDRLREAIQVFSTDVRELYVYAHTGWRKVGGKWIYLHAGRTDVQVALEPSLSRYTLPEVPEDVAGALRDSLALLDIGPDEVTIPLLAAVYLAPLCESLHPDFVIFLVGKTGSLKSTLVAVFLSHYGHFDRTSLPGSWESTDNALERHLFFLKDVLCVIDDYAPRADAYAQRRQAGRAQRVIRSMGNLSGRSRLKTDLSEQKKYIPRGLMVSTGEDLPPGQSVMARILAVEIDRDRLDLEQITEAQQQVGRLPHAMAGYIEWLTPQLDELAQVLPEQWRQHRSHFAQSAAHLRIPEILAYLALGMDLLLSFARDSGVLSADEIQKLAQRTHQALLSQGEKHGPRVQEEDPAEVFLSTLSAMLAQGAVTLCHREAGGDPLNMVGWNDETYAYLIPQAAHQAVGRYLREGGGHFPYSARALNEALDKRGTLVKGTDNRPTRLVKIRGKNRRVLQIPMNLLEPEEENEDEVQG